MQSELLLASQIAETTRTSGWKIMRTMIEENIRSLDTLEGVQTLRDVEARRKAKNALEKFLGEIDAIVMAAEMNRDVKRIEEKSLYKSLK